MKSIAPSHRAPSAVPPHEHPSDGTSRAAVHPPIAAAGCRVTPVFGKDLRLDKEITKGRMCFVRRLSGDDHFGITGHSRTFERGCVLVIFTRRISISSSGADHDLRIGIDTEVPPPKFHMSGREQYFIILWRRVRWVRSVFDQKLPLPTSFI